MPLPHHQADCSSARTTLGRATAENEMMRTKLDDQAGLLESLEERSAREQRDAQAASRDLALAYERAESLRDQLAATSGHFCMG